MNTLREQVDRLTSWPCVTWGRDKGGPSENRVVIDRKAVLALIPEDAVLVTPESLMEATCRSQTECDGTCPEFEGIRPMHGERVAAILSAIRETS